MPFVIRHTASAMYPASSVDAPKILATTDVDFVVVIATSDRPTLLKRTLDSLARCAMPTGFRETIVVENGPQRGAKEIVESSPAWLYARYMHAPTPNKSMALNSVLKTLDESFIFFTDDDVRFEPETLSAYADAAHDCGAGHFYGGPTSVDYENEPTPWLKKLLPYSAQGWEWNGNPRRVDRATFLGFNWGAFLSDIRGVGEFNPDRGPGSPTKSTGQESDMQRRFIEHGIHGIYVPAARVWHYVPKRCLSHEWIIDRSFRHGIEQGLTSTCPRGMMGLPPSWTMRRYAKSLVRLAVYSLSGSDEQELKSKCQLAYERGYLDGLKQRFGHDRLIKAA